MGGLSVVEMVEEVGRLVSPSLVEVVEEAARTFFTNSFLTINFLPSAAAAAALLGLALVCEFLVPLLMQDVLNPQFVARVHTI